MMIGVSRHVGVGGRPAPWAGLAQGVSGADGGGSSQRSTTQDARGSSHSSGHSDMEAHRGASHRRRSSRSRSDRQDTTGRTPRYPQGAAPQNGQRARSTENQRPQRQQAITAHLPAEHRPARSEARRGHYHGDGARQGRVLEAARTRVHHAAPRRRPLPSRHNKKTCGGGQEETSFAKGEQSPVVFIV